MANQRGEGNSTEPTTRCKGRWYVLLKAKPTFRGGFADFLFPRFRDRFDVRFHQWIYAAGDREEASRSCSVPEEEQRTGVYGRASKHHSANPSPGPSSPYRPSLVAQGPKGP